MVTTIYKSNRHMKPYVSSHKWQVKYKAEHFDGTPGTAKGITKTNKLEAKNANRSLKKSQRQESLRYIREALLQD